MTYEEAKKMRDDLEAQVRKTGALLRSFPRDNMGLVSDTTRTNEEYQKAKAAFDSAFARLRTFNASFVKMKKK